MKSEDIKFLKELLIDLTSHQHMAIINLMRCNGTDDAFHVNIMKEKTEKTQERIKQIDEGDSK